MKGSTRLIVLMFVFGFTLTYNIGGLGFVDIDVKDTAVDSDAGRRDVVLAREVLLCQVGLGAGMSELDTCEGLITYPGR